MTDVTQKCLDIRQMCPQEPPAPCTVYFMNNHERGETLNIQELAALLRVSKTTIRRKVAAGEIGHNRMGKVIRFTPEHVRDFLLTVERKRVADVAASVAYFNGEITKAEFETEVVVDHFGEAFTVNKAEFEAAKAAAAGVQ